MNPGDLRKCSECGHDLPADWDWDMRSLRWLRDLPRGISPTNNDLEIHDGLAGRNRFLHLELKPDDQPLQKGQLWHLEGKARMGNFTVLLVRGKRVDHISVEQIRKPGVVLTTAARLAASIGSWLQGARWTMPTDEQPVHVAPDDILAGARLGWPIEKYAKLAWPGSTGQNPDGTWGDLGWLTKELYEYWG